MCQVLADLAIGRMRSKTADLSMALGGRFAERHAMLCRLHLDHIVHLEATIAELDARIEAMMQPFLAARDLLITIPGIVVLAAAAVISKIGPIPGSTSRPPGTWHRGLACAPATTSPRASGTPANAAAATPTSSRSWSRSPGALSVRRATSVPLPPACHPQRSLREP